MKRLLLLLAAPLLGCPPSDLCQPEADSERTFFVRPALDPGPDNHTVAHTFHSIQAALDAAGGDRGRATICVTRGTYREQLVIPPDTHLIADPLQVKIRPPQTRAGTLPTAVDRILVTAATGPEGSIVLDGIDVRGAGLCVDATGGGAVTIRDSVIADCAVGLRARGGGTVTLDTTPVDDHALRGIDAMGSRVEVVDGTLLRNGRPALWHAQEAVLDAPAESLWSKDLLPGRGAIAGQGADIELSSVSIDETEFDAAVVRLSGGTLVATDLRIGAQRPAANTEGFLTGDAGGTGPVFSFEGTGAVLDRVVARTEGLGLVGFTGGDNALSATNLSWSGQLPTTSDASAGAALSGTGSGIVRLLHTTLLGPEAAWGIDLDGGPWDVDITNGILWGQTTGRGIRLPSGDAPTLQDVLVEDDTLSGTGLITGQAPGLDDRAEGLLIPADSPARCAGSDQGVALDLNGDPRPFTDGKAPDLGAIELQQACP